jgi:uncharacterized membrane protein YoaK (UPF0700 family)
MHPSKFVKSPYFELHGFFVSHQTGVVVSMSAEMWAAGN